MTIITRRRDSDGHTGCGFYRYNARIGKLIAPTNKKFHIEFCTVAHWKNGAIVEEKLFYDLVGLLKQIGVM